MSNQENYINPDLDMEYQPLVSVVIPVYNNEETIEDTLKSILSQDYKNIEVIIVNDGSTDGTNDVLDQYRDIVKIINQTNAGSAVARTQGIKNAAGKYIAFIDADDLWVPWKISTQVRYLEQHTDIGMVFNSWIELHDQSDDLPQTPPDSITLNTIEEENSGWLYTRLLMECVVHTSSVVLLKKICDEIGEFDANLRRGQDYDYWLRVSQVTKIIKLKSILSAYRIHSNNITKQVPQKNFEAIILNNAIQKFGLSDQDGREISRYVMRERLGNSWKNFCWQAYYAGQYSKSFYSGIKIVKYKPFWYIGWAYLFASLTRIVLNGFTKKVKPVSPAHPVD